jgi:DNA-binding NtrC family response regulator
MQNPLTGEPYSENRIVLSVSPKQEDHTSLKELLMPWLATIYEADCLSCAQELIQSGVGVVMCERDLLGGSWLDILELLAGVPNSPPLIVTSRLADDSLWAEALNRGAYDVLQKPFDQQELLRTVNLAWLHWHHGQAPISPRQESAGQGSLRNTEAGSARERQIGRHAGL